MIVRLDLDQLAHGSFAYRVSHETDMLYDDEDLPSLGEALVAAIEGLPPETIGIELAYGGIVSGTYPLDVLAANLTQVATHAVNTTAAIAEARDR